MDALPQVIDTHCHLDFPEFDADRDQVVARSRAEGVVAMVNVGSTVETSARAVALAAVYPGLYACVGVHPHDADAFTPRDLATLKELCKKSKVVGIGETGLDYYRTLSSPANQRRVFEECIDLGLEKGLPLVIHTREAQAETLEILKAKKVSRAIIHCFSGGPDFLSACLDLGFYVSFTGNITYRKADLLREAAKLCPLDRVCVETDAPYLPPEGRRGTRNDPTGAKVACEKLAEIKGIPFAEAAAATTANARRFFGI